MIVACPKCKARYKVDDEKVGDQGLKLRCTKCSTIFKVAKKAGGSAQPSPPLQQPRQAAAPPPPPQHAPPPPPPPQHAPPPPPPQPAGEQAPGPSPEAAAFAGAQILVATVVDEARDKIDRVIKTNGMIPLHTSDGIEALEIIKQQRPKVVILDVMLPKLLGFEISELMKNDPDLRGIPVILLAAQLNSHRFKRPPKSLYGADGYLEIKDISDMTAELLIDLMSGRKPRRPMAESEIFPHSTAAESAAPELSAQAPSPPPGPQVAPPPPSPPPAPVEEEIPPEEKKDHEKAKRLARVIVSEIQLYNQDAVTEGVKNGNFYDLLAKDIADARKLYEQRVPEYVRQKTNYLEENLQALIQKKKEELGLA